MAKKIIFIEDEPALHKTLGEKLKEKGYNLISATDGEEGLNLIKKEKPDVVVLDLILPKLHGFEVLQEINKEEELKSIPVIVLTNLENPADIEQALSLGAKAYLVKANYSLEELVKKIEDLIKKFS